MNDKMKFTPLHLSLLIQAYSHPALWPNRNVTVEAYEAHLVTFGLIKESDGGYYDCTERGKAHVEQLLSIPLPFQAWIGVNGEIIKTNHE